MTRHIARSADARGDNGERQSPRSLWTVHPWKWGDCRLIVMAEGIHPRSRSAGTPPWMGVGSLLLVMGRRNRNNGTIRDEEKRRAEISEGTTWSGETVLDQAVGPSSQRKRTNFAQESSLHKHPVNIADQRGSLLHRLVREIHKQFARRRRDYIPFSGGSNFQLFDGFGSQ